ncbi:hypothetical protein NUW54_g1236 [Trametes sanguinea]|uniref:Uncharacterized protein n=1 Tax=Trametes sanguinea TaxID=158606 RepID=A0ACC1QAP1_9APHY|nr:hypothetical protein NUW54_g1236 [Trametes sanguinea]
MHVVRSSYWHIIEIAPSPAPSRSAFIPIRVLIHLDPGNPPRELAKVNGSLRSLVEELDRDGVRTKENVRICENFACGMPIEDVEELKKRLPLIADV